MLYVNFIFAQCATLELIKQIRIYDSKEIISMINYAQEFYNTASNKQFNTLTKTFAWQKIKFK